MEIYTFLRMGGTVDRISVLPASESTVKDLQNKKKFYGLQHAEVWLPR